MNKRDRFCSFALSAVCGLLIGPCVTHACDTTGVNVTPYNFNQPNLTEMKWTAAVSEFDFSSGILRIEFNGISFSGPSGGVSMGAMIQNLLHKYAEAACVVDSLPGGLELYFSVIDNLTSTPPQVAGISLNADPNSFPTFRRIFQNIDGSGSVGNNIYSNDAVGVAALSAPVVLQWHIARGNLITNPAGNLKKDINCNWVALAGDFRQWTLDVTVNGTNYPVATYYLPEAFGQYLYSFGPFVLHQEHFGACNNRLSTTKGEVQYYDFQVLPEGGSMWIPIQAWQLNYDYGGDCGNGACTLSPPTDLRHGLGTSVLNGQKTILSRVGHNNDYSMKRCSNETAVGGGPQWCSPVVVLSSVFSGSEVTISNGAAAPQGSAATITWTTSRAADGMIRYGTTSNYGTDSTWSSSPSTSHSIRLSGLASRTVYYYRIESIDSDGHRASMDGSFVTHGH